TTPPNILGLTGTAPRGSLPGLTETMARSLYPPEPPPLNPKPPPFPPPGAVWHPRLWDIHIFSDPRGGPPRLGILDPFGIDLPGFPSPLSAFFYPDPETFAASRYQLVLDMTSQPL